MRKLLFISLFLISYVTYSQNSEDQFREDYLDACNLISKKYVYFERKVNQTREAFYNEHKNFADSIYWDAERFVQEIHNLRCLFPDGHFSWSVTKQISPLDKFYTLGFVSTFTNDSALIVKKVYKQHNKKLFKNDTILTINNILATEFIKQLGDKEPQSTINATLEVAARNLTLKKYISPLDFDLSKYTIEVKNGKRNKTIKAEWQECGLTSNVFEARNNSELLLVQRNGYLSLEEIPENYYSNHSSFYLYNKTIDSVSFSILHLRDFFAWEVSDIDSMIQKLNEIKSDYLVLDLKDCSGGAFDEMLYLSYALGVNKSFKFFYDNITNTDKRYTGVSDFDFITEKIQLNNSWNGKVIVRSNEICGSACDFFIRWMKINNRALIVGNPPAGRGGGTDQFELSNTKTTISFPQRERIPIQYHRSVEGDIMNIDLISEETILNILEKIKSTNNL
ncbi:MAG: hypothetical protein JEY96_04135 [Bacteroidales bacterium]|nr:hypothetical protein [Bacteroidales bacterium]